MILSLFHKKYQQNSKKKNQSIIPPIDIPAF